MFSGPEFGFLLTAEESGSEEPVFGGPQMTGGTRPLQRTETRTCYHQSKARIVAHEERLGHVGGWDHTPR